MNPYINKYIGYDFSESRTGIVINNNTDKYNFKQWLIECSCK